MIQIGDTIISLDIFEKKFCCDLAVCKGICCVDGDSGAPLEEGEAEQIRENYEKIKPYMKPEGIAAVEEQGFSVVDIEGDTVTPLIDGRECAYIIEENGCSWCAIEKAWSREESSFRKPISCHMLHGTVIIYKSLSIQCNRIGHEAVGNKHRLAFTQTS